MSDFLYYLVLQLYLLRILLLSFSLLGNMEQLTEELLGEIFCYLTPGEIKSVSLTNHHFHNIIDNSITLWQSLAVPLTKLQSEISSPLKHFDKETITELKKKVFEAWKRLCVLEAIKGNSQEHLMIIMT